MVSNNFNSIKTEQNDSFEKSTENVYLKEEDIGRLNNNLPVTVFRKSSGLPWGLDYISTNVEKLTGYSKMDFMDQKLSWSDTFFPEDITKIDMLLRKQ